MISRHDRAASSAKMMHSTGAMLEPPAHRQSGVGVSGASASTASLDLCIAADVGAECGWCFFSLTAREKGPSSTSSAQEGQLAGREHGHEEWNSWHFLDTYPRIGACVIGVHYIGAAYHDPFLFWVV